MRSLTLDDVAHHAGIGKSSLYRRFRDRTDLATAAIASAPARPAAPRRGPARRPHRLPARRRGRPRPGRRRRHRVSAARARPRTGALMIVRRNYRT